MGAVGFRVLTGAESLKAASAAIRYRIRHYARLVGPPE